MHARRRDNLGAVDDRDPRRVVEAPGEDDTGEGCPAVAGRERQRRWRSSTLNSRAQPNALSAWAPMRSSPVATSTPGSPLESGQEARREVAGGQQQERGRNRTVSGRECPAPLSRPTKARERPRPLGDTCPRARSAQPRRRSPPAGRDRGDRAAMGESGAESCPSLQEAALALHRVPAEQRRRRLTGSAGSSRSEYGCVDWPCVSGPRPRPDDIDALSSAREMRD